jgi:hypothetical protein
MTMDKLKEHPFGEEIAIILKQRFTLQADNTLEILAEGDEKISEEDLPKLLSNVFNKIYSNFFDEIKRYSQKKRNRKNSYMVDIARAKKGDNQSLSRLIAWDKSWLFIDWVKDVILHAQDDQDTILLQELGQALAAEPGVNIPIAARDKQERKEMLDNIKSLIAYYVTMSPNIEKSEIINTVIKEFHGVLRDTWDHWSNDDSEIVMNPEYFKRYLKRQKVI